MFVNHTGEGGFTRGRRRVTGERAVTSIFFPFQVNANVSGLVGTGLVLQVAFTDVTNPATLTVNAPLTANGTTFDAADVSGIGHSLFDTYSYVASILTQPVGPAQVASIISGSTGSGTASGYSTVYITCSAATQGFWQDFVGTEEL